jgi:SHS2 domain-containing protein
MGDVAEFPFEGVMGLDHTADVGLEVEAPTLPELFRRGALGAMWLVLEREATADPGSSGQRRPLRLAEEDLPALFRAWLRTLLFWEETEGFVTLEAALSFAPVPLCSSEDGQAFGLEARVSGLTDTGPRVREVKGVTLHGLQVTRVDRGWMARVIFDV